MRKFNVRWWRDDPDWKRKRYELMIREWNCSARKIVEFSVSTVRQPPQVVSFYEPPSRRIDMPPWLEMIWEEIVSPKVFLEGPPIGQHFYDHADLTKCEWMGVSRN